MAGFTGSFKDSLLTLIGLRKHASEVSPGQAPATPVKPQPTLPELWRRVRPLQPVPSLSRSTLPSTPAAPEPDDLRNAWIESVAMTPQLESSSSTEMPAMAEESSMATASITPNVPVPATAKTSKFKSIMEHLLSFVTLGLKAVINYSAPAEILAQALFPEYAGLEKEAQVKVVQVATLLQSAVLSAQQKYASATASDETNNAKLADVLQTVEQPALSLLADVKVPADTSRITNAIEATVAILKTNPAPTA